MNTTSSPAAGPEKLFCCSTVFINKKINIPPFHPLHHLLAHLSELPNHDDDDDRASELTLDSQAVVPGPNESVIIILSDPTSPWPAGSTQPFRFNPSTLVSRMFRGRFVHTPNPNLAQNTRPSAHPSSTGAPATDGQGSAGYAATAATWVWKENLRARSNTAGLLVEIGGVERESLRKEMTGCECPEHRWKYTMVVLIGLDLQTREKELENNRDRDTERARQTLLEMAAAAGSRAGAREGAPEVPPGCDPQ